MSQPEQTRDDLALEVAQVWTRNNAWIPGGAKGELEAVLGIPLPLPAIGDPRPQGGTLVYKDEPGRLIEFRETYAEWKARQ